jgi:hypothetical protein
MHLISEICKVVSRQTQIQELNIHLFLVQKNLYRQKNI